MGTATGRPESVASARGGGQKIENAENINEHMIYEEDEDERAREG
jgi:hypothetical protein